MNSRRNFIKRCSGALLGSAAAPAFGTLASTRMAGAVPAGFTEFSAHVDSVFRMATGSGAVLPVTLSKVEIYQPSHRPDLASEDNFSLHFTGTASEPLKQGTYGFHHPVLGEIDIFVVAHADPAAGRSEYVATFHRTAISA